MVRIADEMREDNFCRAPRGKDQASVTHQWRNRSSHVNAGEAQSGLDGTFQP